MTKIEKFRTFFDTIYNKYNRIEFINSDPIVFPHKIKGNTEFIAFCASCFAYGNVGAIQKFLNSFFDEFGTDPLAINKKDTALYYRFQKPVDILAFVWKVKEIYEVYGSIENAFLASGENLEESLNNFTILMKKISIDAKIGQGYGFLFPDPVKSGAKRLRMFLRWMVRCDDVDFGLWKNYTCKDLHFIIDTHILRFAYKNGIINNSSSTRKNLETVTSFFRQMNPCDPAKYDFAISRLGIIFNCTYEASQKCFKCEEKNICPFR